MAKLFNEDIVKCIDLSFDITEILGEHIQYFEALEAANSPLMFLYQAATKIRDARFALSDYKRAAHGIEMSELKFKTPVQHRADYVPPDEDLDGPVF